MGAFSAHSRLSSAFSLIELLTVIAIIAIMSGLGTIAFNSISKGNSVRGAVDVVAGMTLAARVEAMSHGLGAKLVIDNGSDPKYKLRRIAIFRAEGTDAASKEWKQVGRPVLLREGTFFLSSHANPTYGSSNEQTGEKFTLSGTTETDCIVYEFDGAGHLINPGRMVFVGGIMESDGTLTIPPGLLAGRSGFRLPANGRPAFFKSPDQIQ